MPARIDPKFIKTKFEMRGSEYSGDPDTGHQNTRTIQKLDKFMSVALMIWFSDAQDQRIKPDREFPLC
jgi:hypothetical protein